MSLFIFFGGTATVILVGIAVVVHGYRHHYLEDKKKKAEKEASV